MGMSGEKIRTNRIRNESSVWTPTLASGSRSTRATMYVSSMMSECFLFSPVVYGILKCFPICLRVDMLITLSLSQSHAHIQSISRTFNRKKIAGIFNWTQSNRELTLQRSVFCRSFRCALYWIVEFSAIWYHFEKVKLLWNRETISLCKISFLQTGNNERG